MEPPSASWSSPPSGARPTCRIRRSRFPRFSADTLKDEKVKGGQDILLQVPNTNFTRRNFGGFNLKIRGIGTDVIGAGGTQGVSINENELPVTVQPLPGHRLLRR